MHSLAVGLCAPAIARTDGPLVDNLLCLRRGCVGEELVRCAHISAILWLKSIRLHVLRGNMFVNCWAAAVT